MLGSNLWGNHFQSGQLAPLRMAWRQGNVLQLWQRKALGSVKSRVLRWRYETPRRCDRLQGISKTSRNASIFKHVHHLQQSHTRRPQYTRTISQENVPHSLPLPMTGTATQSSFNFLYGQKWPDEVSFSRGILSSRSSRMVKAPGSRPMKASKLATWQKVIRWSLSEATESTVLLCT